MDNPFELQADAQTLANQLMEGVHDKYRFKAVFVIGSTGSGKTWLAQHVAGGFGLKQVNSDIALEHFLNKEKMHMDMGAYTTDEVAKKDALRDKAKGLARAQQAMWTKEGMGIILDGTGRWFDKIKKTHDMLTDGGYDSFMISVNTTLAVALERNATRPRKVPADVAEEVWKNAQANMGKYCELFGGNNYLIVDNNQRMSANHRAIIHSYRRVKAFLERPLSARSQHFAAHGGK